MKTNHAKMRLLNLSRVGRCVRMTSNSMNSVKKQKTHLRVIVCIWSMFLMQLHVVGMFMCVSTCHGHSPGGQYPDWRYDSSSISDSIRLSKVVQVFAGIWVLFSATKSDIKSASWIGSVEFTLVLSAVIFPSIVFVWWSLKTVCSPLGRMKPHLMVSARVLYKLDVGFCHQKV